MEGLSCVLTHAIFNRHGGVSPPPYDSLNLSFNVGDSPENVQSNRRKVKEAQRVETLVSTGQVHGTDILTIEEKINKDSEIKGYDALITNQPGAALLIQLADCQAVMLFDPAQKVVANIHCGWRGNVADIITETIDKMAERFGCRSADLHALISPSLGPCCAEFKNWQQEFPRSFYKYQVSPNYFDLWAVSRDQLCRAGVRPGNIHTCSICTKCNPEWFSYRREQETGRFGALIGLKK